MFILVKNNSGWGWDHERNIPTAQDDVWAAYIKAHPEAKEFRYQSLPLFDKLDELFSGTVVTGEHAKGTARNTKKKNQPPTSAISNTSHSKEVLDVDLIPSSGETKEETEDFSPLPPSDLNHRKRKERPLSKCLIHQTRLQNCFLERRTYTTSR